MPMPATEPSGERPVTATLEVCHRGGDRFEIAVRGHLVVVDQPVADGGEDTGPTPTELFVAGLAACVAFYARRFLARHGLPSDGLAVSTSYRLAHRPARVEEVRITLRVPGLPEGRRDALLAVARHCTVHNSLEQPPQVAIELAA
jgi:putative redox protein